MLSSSRSRRPRSTSSKTFTAAISAVAPAIVRSSTACGPSPRTTTPPRIQPRNAVSIQQLIDHAADVIGRRPAEQTTGLVALKRHLAFLAGYQVRSSGSVAGNVFMTRDHAQRGEPFPSDLFTVLATLGATIVIGSS